MLINTFYFGYTRDIYKYDLIMLLDEIIIVTLTLYNDVVIIDDCLKGSAVKFFRRL